MEVVFLVFRVERCSGQPTINELRRSRGSEQCHRYRNDKSKRSFGLGHFEARKIGSSHLNRHPELRGEAPNSKDSHKTT